MLGGWDAWMPDLKIVVQHALVCQDSCLGFVFALCEKETRVGNRPSGCSAALRLKRSGREIKFYSRPMHLSLCISTSLIR